MRSKNTFIFLIVAIVSFLVYWFFIRKKTVKTPAPTPASPETPSATMGEAVVTFKPDKDGDEPEAYTEYAEGDTDWADLSKNVEIKLTWDNKAGFNNTTKITIRRVIETGSGDQTTTKTYDHVFQRYDADGNEIAVNKDIFKNYKSGLTYTVTHKSGATSDSDGNLIAYSVLGKNTYSIWYTLTDGRTAKLTEDPETGDKTELEETFTPEDLSLTLDMVKRKTRLVTPSSASDAEATSAVSENNVYLLTKNTYGNPKKKNAFKNYRLDKVTKQICNKNKGYETTDKNAFRLYCNDKEKHVAVKFKYKTDGAPDGMQLICTDQADKINETCVDGTFCTTFKMVQDQYTKGTGDDANKDYYAFRVSNCNKTNRIKWGDRGDQTDPDNTRGTGDLLSTVDAYLVANPNDSGKLSVKTMEQMTDQELRDGHHAFEMLSYTGTSQISSYHAKKIC
jgi:hypothetical protein